MADAVKYNPLVAWRTTAKDVHQLTRETVNDPATYRITVKPSDRNDTGAGEIAAGMTFTDYYGVPYKIIATETVDVPEPSGCIQVTFRAYTDYIDDWIVELSNVDEAEATNSFIGTDTHIQSFGAPIDATTNSEIYANTYASLSEHTLWTCLDEAKVTQLQFYDCALSDINLDLTAFTGLASFILARYGLNVDATQSISFPATAYNGIYPRDGELLRGVYIYLEALDNLTTLDLVAYAGNYNRIYASMLPMLTNFNIPIGWEGNDISIYDCNNLTALDFSNASFVAGQGILGRWAEFSTLRVQNCIGLTNLILPYQFTVTDYANIIVNGCTSLGYIDFSPTEIDILGLDVDFQFYLQSNSFTTAQVNRMLVEINAITVTHTGLVAEINISMNSAPDNGSGGYDGLTAKASLQGKGITVITD